MIVPHKTGQGLKVFALLQEHKVNLLAFLAFPKKGKAQIDFVPVDPAKFVSAAKQAKWKIKGPKTCLLIEGKDQIGTFVPHAQKLAEAKINIRATAAVTGGAGRCGTIVWVEPKQVKKAAGVLSAK